ncbi:hypothetical protein FB446DRAFT_794666 [Lentinula raphanica]|nr:hypothetical protein FB446DRAFT_794666 [Lentinula raphanica]
MLHLGRTIFNRYLGIVDRTELVNWSKFTTPPERVQQFREAPTEHRPRPQEGLDMSTGTTASDMAASPWNKYIVRELASSASVEFAKNPSYYVKKGDMVEWHELFRDRMYRYLHDMEKAKGGTLISEYEIKKKASQLRSARSRKLKRRIRICEVMINHHADHDNVAEATRWVETLRTLQDLQVNGMSDDEEAIDESGRKYTLVYSPTWRNPTFDTFFDNLDSTRSSDRTLFNDRIGRPRNPRVRTHQTAKCTPPQGLPTSYYREGFGAYGAGPS